MKSNKIVYSATGVLLALVVCSTAYAVSRSRTGLSLELVGSLNNGAKVFAGINPNPDLCKFGGVYFQDQAELDQALSVTMTAKVSGKTTRIDYDIDVDGFCLGKAIYLE